MSLFSSLQDPEKVASFQRLCGVRLEPGSSAQVGDDADRLANGVCPAQAHADGGGEGGGGRHRFPGAASHPDEKGDLGPPSDAAKEEEENGGECQRQAEPVQHSWGSKRQPRRNSLTGESVCQEFSVSSPFLYYLFSLGTELGNELFYFLFFSFSFWNMSPWLGRRLMIVWVWVMYLGQCAKDVIRWPRPASPPVVKLEVFYNSEYSMPSTHAMSGTAVPVVLFLCSYKLWQYHFMYGLILVFCWCSLVCFSRIYMGMHSILDVIAGVLFAVLILAVFLPTLDLVDSFNLTCKYAPLIIISLHLALGIFSFTLDTWSTSRGDTAQILGCGAGVACGSHVMYMLSLMPDPSPEMLPLLLPPLTVTLVGKTMLRLLIGVVILFLTKDGMKKVTIPLACKIFSIPCDDIRQARQRMEVELPYRYITYGMVGFSLSFLVPALFHIMGLS